MRGSRIKDQLNAQGNPHTMTRKDFELIADVLRHELEHVACGVDQSDTVNSIAHTFALRLSTTNPNFNRARFLQACGVTD